MSFLFQFVEMVDSIREKSVIPDQVVQISLVNVNDNLDTSLKTTFFVIEIVCSFQNHE